MGYLQLDSTSQSESTGKATTHEAKTKMEPTSFSPADKIPDPVKSTTESTSNSIHHDADVMSHAADELQNHPDLQMDLTRSVIIRVSKYCLIDHMNKEFSKKCGGKTPPVFESHGPLVSAVKGQKFKAEAGMCKSDYAKAVKGKTKSTTDSVMIDEESWLVSMIEAHNDEIVGDEGCPPTFLQAIGKKSYENPGDTPLLWKPWRSYWESDNSHLDPSSHAKRWRYLLPFVYYHRFLLKMIKKLKRSKIDVVKSSSPVAAFIRKEVCAISDHLAAVSLFQPARWAKCLQCFNGWIDTNHQSNAQLRAFVLNLQLRHVLEAGSVDRTKHVAEINEHFIVVMKMICENETHQGEHSSHKPPRHMHHQSNSNGGRKRRGSKAKQRVNKANGYQGRLQGYGPSFQYGMVDDASSIHSSQSYNSFDASVHSDRSEYSIITQPGATYQPYFPPQFYYDSTNALQNQMYDPNIAMSPMNPMAPLYTIQDTCAPNVPQYSCNYDTQNYYSHTYDYSYGSLESIVPETGGEEMWMSQGMQPPVSVDKGRQSPSTVDTQAETASIND